MPQDEPDTFIEHSVTEDKACQVPENAHTRQGYECVGHRRKLDLRSEIMCKIDALLDNYTSDGEEGRQAIMNDILSSQKFQGKFGDVFTKHRKQSSDDKILKLLAKDYVAAKDKESSKLIRAQGAKVANKLIIGDSMKTSNLIFSGVKQGKNRIETAQAIGRLSKFGDERRRLLSIVACDFSMSELQEYFPCSKSTITAARVHAILFGRGGVPRDGLSFTRQAVSPEIIQEFQNFITQDDISRPSSCRSVLVDGKETGVRYWLCDIKEVIQQYQLKFPGGLKRTYIYSHLPKNFRMNSMLAGLCSLCDDFGHSNFDSLELLLGNIREEGVISVSTHSNFTGMSRQYQKFLKVQFPKEVRNRANYILLHADFILCIADRKSLHNCGSSNKITKVGYAKVLETIL